MEIYKNKVGQGFILIKEQACEKGLFITPELAVKPLKLSLFEEVEIEAEEALKIGLITQSQIERFNKYLDDELGNDLENIDYELEQMTQIQREIRIKRLRQRGMEPLAEFLEERVKALGLKQ